MVLPPYGKQSEEGVVNRQWIGGSFVPTRANDMNSGGWLWTSPVRSTFRGLPKPGDLFLELRGGSKNENAARSCKPERRQDAP
jgi:hypothetical protein